MDEIVKLSKELRDELESLELFKEYKRIKTLVNNNEELQSLKVEIAKSSSNVVKHEELLKTYNSNPLMSNLLELENEVKSYLMDVTKIINKK